MGQNLKIPISRRFFSLKSNLPSNLNHSIWTRNDHVMTKTLTLVQNRTLGTGTDFSVLLPVDQNTCGTGTTLFGTNTKPRKCPKMMVFLPFFHIFPPKPTQYSIHTSKPLHIHLVTSILLKSSFNIYLTSKTFHELLPKQL